MRLSLPTALRALMSTALFLLIGSPLADGHIVPNTCPVEPAAPLVEPTPSPALHQTSAPFLFMENKGQIRDQHGDARPDVLFLARDGAVK
ncbi:MAG: hypothetical protein KDC54_04905, partial [Lewinella sp.]|nr:hypothetical protein [Lewinella sp.]